jgi:Secretion system C-terminal sorting domain
VYSYSIAVNNTTSGVLNSSDKGHLITSPINIGTGNQTLQGTFVFDQTNSCSSNPGWYALNFFVYNSTTQSGCSQELCIETLPDCCTSIAARKSASEAKGEDRKNDWGNKLLLVPNPAERSTEIRFVLNDEKSEICILDMYQRTIETFRPGQKEGFIRFNIESLKSGMYLVCVKNNDKIVLVEKLIVY